MTKKKTKIELAQEETQKEIDNVNLEIENLGSHTAKLYLEVNMIQEMIDNISNVPTESTVELDELKNIRSEWKSQAEKIENDYRDAYKKEAGAGAAGVGLGVGIAALGPTAAMGVATTFGVASTGTAIAALHGAAATNAALAWLGGGTLAASGGGIAAGKALLAMAGPVGWAVAGIAFISGGIAFLVNRNDHKIIEEVFTLISKRDVTSYKLATTELKERILRIEDESNRLHAVIKRFQSFGLNYDEMSEAEQYELGSYLNLINSSTQLLINPILGLQPKYTEEDYERFFEEKASHRTGSDKAIFYEENKEVIIYLCNLLYKINLNEKQRKLLWETFRGNKQFLESLNRKKKDFPFRIIGEAYEALQYKFANFL